MRPIIQGIVVICRDGLDHVPLSNSIPDSELRPFATLGKFKLRNEPNFLSFHGKSFLMHVFDVVTDELC
jgi:hypothetical protein